MKKIPSLWVRDQESPGALYLHLITPGCEWVATDGVPTRKWDGTACLVREGKLFARYDAKHGKAPPPDFEPAQEAPDPVTGHWPGWLEVKDQPQFKWHREAWRHHMHFGRVMDGTYELLGPKVGGNPEGVDIHVLARHGGEVLDEAPREFWMLRAWLETRDMEGVVFHHPDGRMAKATKQGYGMKRKP